MNADNFEARGKEEEEAPCLLVWISRTEVEEGRLPSSVDSLFAQTKSVTVKSVVIEVVIHPL